MQKVVNIKIHKQRIFQTELNKQPLTLIRHYTFKFNFLYIFVINFSSTDNYIG